MPSSDVNVLVAAYDKSSVHHNIALEWLLAILGGDAQFTVFPIVLSAFLRIMTRSPRLVDPSQKAECAAFIRRITSSPNFVASASTKDPTERLLMFFDTPGVQGNAVPDAYLAALAIEHDCEWVTFDRGFARVSGPALAAARLTGLGDDMAVVVDCASEDDDHARR